MADSDGRRRRRERRNVDASSSEPAGDGDGRERPARKRSARDGGLHDIVGAGRSQLGVSGALRGRDVNRPTASDLAEAERGLVIVRRHWKPPA
jgi:hypothetical protein